MRFLLAGFGVLARFPDPVSEVWFFSAAAAGVVGVVRDGGASWARFPVTASRVAAASALE